MKRILMLVIVFFTALTVMVGCSRDKDVQVEQAPRETPDTPAVAEKVAVKPRPRTVQEGAILPTSATHEVAADVSDDARRAALVEGNTTFALDLYKKLAAKSEGGNVVFSPYSVSAALAMTYAGARGETAAQMAQVLRFPADHEALHPEFAGLDRRLREGCPELRLANALWGQRGSHFERDFLSLTRRHYGAEMGRVDFSGDTEGARRTINGWVAEQTRDKIPELLRKGHLNGRTKLVLTNAVYLLSDWESPFPLKNSRVDDFHLTTDKRVRARMMGQRQRLPYWEGDGVQVLELPYQDSQLSFVVVLPKYREGLADVEDGLTAARLNRWMKALQVRLTDVRMPAFTMRSECELSDQLKALGMVAPFGAGADFSGITGGKGLHISKVVHEAFVAVDEKGTEAAAATAVVMGGRSGANRPVSFTADHPFFFVIRDRRTNSVLFLGRVTKPATESGTPK